MIYLDTHVVVWLYSGDTKLLSAKAVELIEDNDLYISPVVYLELKFLYEISRIKVSPAEILENLSASIGLSLCEKSFFQIINESISLDWTRDTFDRIIVANAMVNNATLLTKDSRILDNYSEARW
ncbi:MAG: type II toxin-antitoxin system VapC family toxin [Kiritimatiellae bacterium]|nr:type II toxin-antitoxin system VapC family toxin [Kiritimatiellia bacterium]